MAVAGCGSVGLFLCTRLGNVAPLTMAVGRKKTPKTTFLNSPKFAFLYRGNWGARDALETGLSSQKKAEVGAARAAPRKKSMLDDMLGDVSDTDSDEGG